MSEREDGPDGVRKAQVAEAARPLRAPNRASVAKVLAYCARWCVPVILVDEVWGRFAGLANGRVVAATHGGPVDGGICWPERAVLWPRQSSNCQPHALLHELNHVLMDVDPDEIYEVTSGLLALDAFGSRTLRLRGWSDWMSGYTVGDKEWLEITTRQRGKLLQESLAHAVRLGLLDAAGRPTFKRLGKARYLDPMATEARERGR